MIASTSRHLRNELVGVLRDYSPRHDAFAPFKLVGKLVSKSVRMGWHWRSQRAFMRSIGGPTTQQLLKARPRLRFRPHAPYLFLETDLKLRIRFLIAHYAFLNRVSDQPQFARIIEERGMPLWSIEANGTVLAIHLLGPPRHHEGDLALRFLIGDVFVFQIAFSIVPRDCFGLGVQAPSDSPHVIYVGQVQGVVGQASRIREATRLCEAIAPQDLLMSALAGIATAWDISSMLGVAAGRQLAIEDLIVSPHAFDYALFWTRYQSRVSGDGHHVIAVPFRQKPIGEIVNRHRKRTLRKRHFKEALVDQVAQAMALPVR